MMGWIQYSLTSINIALNQVILLMLICHAHLINSKLTFPFGPDCLNMKKEKNT